MDVQAEAGTSSTESSSLYEGLENMSTLELLHGINAEDHKVSLAVNIAIPNINTLVEAIIPRMRDVGGRLFYIGAGTSGRLGVVDASECPPTYGIPQGIVVGVIAGGDSAIRVAVENAEDSDKGAWADLTEQHSITSHDCVIGIAASGRTPYVIGGLKAAREYGCVTGCIVCNRNSIVASSCEYPVEVIVGPEFVTGSTRMKSGTAQKLVLNMISTSVMIRLGKVKGNYMVDMALSNEKLISRAVLMVVSLLKKELSRLQVQAQEEAETRMFGDSCSSVSSTVKVDSTSTVTQSVFDIAATEECITELLYNFENGGNQLEELLHSYGSVRKTVEHILGKWARGAGS